MGTDIINGAGASGGTGRNFDAVGVLNNILRNS
jgi:hypothetical protein